MIHTNNEITGATLVDLTEPLIAQAHASLGRLTVAWGWLDLLTTSRSTRTPRHLSEAARQRMNTLARQERDDRWITARAGLSALAPTPAPLNLGVSVAQTAIYQRVRTLCATLADATNAVYLGATGIRPGMAAATAWLSGTIPAPGETSGTLDQIRDHDLAEYAAAELDRADEHARQAAGVPDLEQILVGVACPSCGQRAVYGDHTSRDWRHWYVRCDNRQCLCAGLGCGCLRPHRDHLAGRRHVWHGHEWALVLAALETQPVEVTTIEVRIDTCQCVCHTGGAYRPACSVVGGCGSVGCDGWGRIAQVAA